MTGKLSGGGGSAASACTPLFAWNGDDFDTLFPDRLKHRQIFRACPGHEDIDRAPGDEARHARCAELAVIGEHDREVGMFDHGACDACGGVVCVENARLIDSASGEEHRVGVVSGDGAFRPGAGQDAGLAVECPARNDDFRPFVGGETLPDQFREVQRIGDDAAGVDQISEPGRR